MKERREGLDLTPEELFLYKKSLFKSQLIVYLNKLCKQSELYGEGQVLLSPEWKDLTGLAAIFIATTVGAGIVSTLAAIGMIATILVPPITVSIAIVGAIAGVGFSIYRYRERKKEYANLAALCQGRDLEEDLNKVVDQIVMLYENCIKNVVISEINKFSQSLIQVIIDAMKKSKIETIDELFEPHKLLHLFVTMGKNTPKTIVDTEITEHDSCTNWGYLTKQAIYCAENKKLYSAKHSNPEKYGIVRLNFDSELQHFNVLMAQEKYDLLSEERKNQLLNHSIFKLDSEKIANQPLSNYSNRN